MSASESISHSVSLADQLVILRVSANPKPEQAVRGLYSEHSVMQTNSSRPEASHLLEVQGRMLRISLEQFESLVRKFSDAGWECPVTCPEVR